MPTILDRAVVVPAGWTAEEWDALVAGLTRRKLIGGGLALGLLTACGATATPTATLPTTRTIETFTGSVVIPTNPQRVICLASYAAKDVLDVGFTPVGVYQYNAATILPAYAKGLEGVATVGAEPDLEKIAGLKPDLILGINTPAVLNLYDQLTAIAPTVLFAFDVPEAWLKMTEQFADAVGRSAQLASLRQQYQDRTAALRTTYASKLANMRWAIAIGAGGGNWRLYFPDSNGGKVLTDAGIRLVSAAADKTGGNKTFSFEQLDQLADADAILVYANNSEHKPDPNSQQMLDQPTWQSLRASQAGQVYPALPVVPNSYNEALALLDEVEAILKRL